MFKQIPDEWSKSVIITIPKKGDSTLCSNYRTISLINHVAKILMAVILERLKPQIEPFLAEEQAGFRHDRSTVQQILILRLLAEKALEKQKPIYNCFIDFQKAFDKIKQDVIWATLRSYNVQQQLIDMLRAIYGQSKAAVRLDDELGEWFNQTLGTRQGDPLSPVIFITYLERIMDVVREESGQQSGVSLHGHLIDNLRFADDVNLLQEDRDALQEQLSVLEGAGEKAGLLINQKKTKSLVFGGKDMANKLKLKGQEVENVEEFEYLGSMLTWNNDCSREIRRRIDKARGVMAGFGKIWSSKDIRVKTKLNIWNACVVSVLLYASETWTYRKRDIDKLSAFQMKSYRRILNIKWQQRITNEEVMNRIGTTRTVMQMAIERKLKFFGHICRMPDDRVVKTAVFGVMEGQNKRGRPRRRWTDDVTEWCNMNIQNALRSAQSRKSWRRLVTQAVNTYGL